MTETVVQIINDLTCLYNSGPVTTALTVGDPFIWMIPSRSEDDITSSDLTIDQRYKRWFSRVRRSLRLVGRLR